MTISLLRRVCTVFIVGSIAGMIVMSIKNNIGGAITAGSVGSAAIMCLMTGNAIHVGNNAGGAQEALAAELEARVSELIAAGVNETAARSVINKAVRLGRGERP
jgi:hypothetical protein